MPTNRRSAQIVRLVVYLVLVGFLLFASPSPTALFVLDRLHSGERREVGTVAAVEHGSDSSPRARGEGERGHSDPPPSRRPVATNEAVRSSPTPDLAPATTMTLATGGAIQIAAEPDPTPEREGRARLLIRMDAPLAEEEPLALDGGAYLTIVASGWEPGEKVVVYLVGDVTPDRLIIPLAVKRADVAGNVAADDIVVPLVDAGDYALLARGDRIGRELLRPVRVAPRSQSTH